MNCIQRIHSLNLRVGSVERGLRHYMDLGGGEVGLEAQFCPTGGLYCSNGCDTVVVVRLLQVLPCT